METILFKNAKILLPLKTISLSWFIVQHGRIKAIGKQSTPLPSYVIDREIDLEQHVVLPAFGDAHLHSLWSAQLLLEIDLKPATSLQQALTILKHHQSQFTAGQWVIGRGFNKNQWSDGQPNRQWLDRLFPQNPVYLESQDCHSAWVNSLAIKTIGLPLTVPDPPGGKFSRDSNGLLNGLVFDRAMEFFKQHLPKPDEEQMLNALNRWVNKLLQNGITHIHVMEGAQALRLWQKYFTRFGHRMRVVFYFPSEEMENLIQAGIHSGFGDQWLKIGGVKFFGDGSLGSQTAALRQPYQGQPSNKGLLMFDSNELLELVKRAQTHFLAVAIHAIGDKAVQQALNVLKQTEHLRQKNQLIGRIEHAQLVPPDLLPLFKQFGLVASMQPIHIADDAKTAQKYWGARSRFAFPAHSLSSAGVPIAFGSDAPVAEPNPIKGIFSAVFRKFNLDVNEPTWIAEETISISQAIAAFTTGVAKAVKLEKHMGTFAIGQAADFVVLSQNPLKADQHNFLNTKVLKTFLAGQELYSEQ